MRITAILHRRNYLIFICSKNIFSLMLSFFNLALKVYFLVLTVPVKQMPILL